MTHVYEFTLSRTHRLLLQWSYIISDNPHSCLAITNIISSWDSKSKKRAVFKKSNVFFFNSSITLESVPCLSVCIMFTHLGGSSSSSLPLLLCLSTPPPLLCLGGREGLKDKVTEGQGTWSAHTDCVYVKAVTEQLCLSGYRVQKLQNERHA